MELSNITYVDSTSNQASNQVNQNNLGKDDFLRLLVTKMSYQDPLNPIEDEDFVEMWVVLQQRCEFRPNEPTDSGIREVSSKGRQGRKCSDCVTE